MSTDFKHTETSIQPIDSGSESAFIGSWSSSSSSSFLTTSFGSELDSNDADLDDTGDGDEFIAELTRRMADYMFEENDDVVILNQEPVENRNHEQTRRSYADTVKKSLGGAQSEQSFTGNEPLQSQSQSQSQLQPPLQSQLQPPIQLYQVENQPRVGGRGRKGKMSESTQNVKTHHSNRSYRGSKEFVNGGSGMRAIFLGGSGSRNVMSGTGVFLPRSSTDATDHSRKKSDTQGQQQW